MGLNGEDKTVTNASVKCRKGQGSANSREWFRKSRRSQVTKHYQAYWCDHQF